MFIIIIYTSRGTSLLQNRNVLHLFFHRPLGLFFCQKTMIGLWISATMCHKLNLCISALAQVEIIRILKNKLNACSTVSKLANYFY